MTGDAPRRARFYAGNVVRALTAPWKQHRVAPDGATTIFGCSYGAAGWQHLRKTLEEYDANPAIGWRDTALCAFLTRFTPSSIVDLVPAAERAREALPLFVYPWGTFRAGETATSKSPLQSRFCGPSTPEFIEAEFARTIARYEAMRRTGYRPWRYPHGFIGGTMLVAAGGRKRFVVLQGNHRFAVLAHLGARRIAVRDVAGFLPFVRESEVDTWPLVAAGRVSREDALRVFHYFFESTGQSVAALIGEGRRARR